MMDDATFKPTECSVEDGNLKCGDTRVDVSVSGEKPSGGTITLESGQVKDINLVISEKTITKNSEGKLVYGEPVTVVFEVDADFVYSEKHEESKAQINLSNLSFNNFESRYEYDLLIDDEFVANTYILYMQGNILVAAGNDENNYILLYAEDSILEISYSDFKIEGKHNIKITNKHKAANDIILLVGDDGTIVLEGEKFVAGEADILITDEDNIKYLEEKVELVSSGIPDFYGADSQCRETLSENIELFNAMSNGKKIKVKVSQIVNGEEIISNIYDSAKEYIAWGGYYVGEIALVHLFGGC